MAKNMAKSDLSRAGIVDRALELADAEGLDAVTIRRLAQELGVTPMALYWHVANKDELLDAMGDRLFEALAYDADSTAPWDEQLRVVVRALVDALRPHPACTELAYRRILVCPQGLALTEFALGLLRRQGFSSRQTADIATHALQTAVMLVGAEPGTEPGSSLDELSEKLAAKRAALHQLPVEQFPYLHEMADDMVHCDDIDAYYDFNIELFVGGTRALRGELTSAG